MSRIIWIFLILFYNTTLLAEVVFEPKITTLATGLQKPWGLTRLPNGDLIITERNGQLRRWDGSSLSKAFSGLPEVLYIGQGGLLDVKAHPDFVTNKTLYFTYSAGTNQQNGTYLAKATLENNGLKNVEVLFKPQLMKQGGYHYAGRIEFLEDNSLIFGIGDGYSYKEHAQKLDSHLGKLIRLNPDGQVPKDNPFINQANALPELYSYGHRNPQGLSFDVKRKILFSNEHGPKGGDEINIIEPKRNYGWPAITYGVDYSGEIISEHTSKPKMEQPLVNWTPSIAPSSMVVYYGDAFSQLNGHLLNTTLKYQELRIVELAGENANNIKVKSQSTHLKHLGERIRDIELDENGNIYLLTDSGKLLKLSKK